MGENDIEDGEYEKIPKKKKFDAVLWIGLGFILMWIVWGYFFLLCE